MTLASGLGSQFGLATESVYGTPVTPNRFVEFDSAGLKLDQNYQESVGLRAGRVAQPAGRTVPTTREAGGQVTLDFVTKGMGKLLDLFHGAVVTPAQQAATAAYKQNHPIGTSIASKSATMQINAPDSGGTDRPLTYPGSMISGWQFSIDSGGKLKLQFTIDAQDEQTGVALAAASYAANTLAFDHLQALAVTMAGTPLGSVRGFTLSGTNPLKADRWFLGSGALKKKPIPNGFVDVSGTLDMEWDGVAAYDHFRSGAKIALVLPFEGATIATTYKEAFKATLAAVQVRGESPSVEGPDVLSSSVAFKALDNGTDPLADLEYQSTDTAL